MVDDMLAGKIPNTLRSFNNLEVMGLLINEKPLDFFCTSSLTYAIDLAKTNPYILLLNLK